MKIAIHGPMGSGKTTLAKILQQRNSQYEIFSFGQKVKDIATELFGMDPQQKDRSLVINVATRMREIDPDVWAKYVMKQTETKSHCIIDDLRFQNELNFLQGWKIISLQTPYEERVKRIQSIYPDTYKDHIQNMNHPTETESLSFPENTYFMDTINPDLKDLFDFLKD